MSDALDLAKRLRSIVIIDEVRSANPLGREAADAIESLTARVAELEAADKSWRTTAQAALR